MFAERLHRARKASGLSVRKLASQVGVSHTAINKYEKGELTPSSGQLLKLSKALGVRSEYFFRPMKVELAGVEYRKRASTPQKLVDRINADVMDQAERWHELLDLYPGESRPVPTFSLPEGLLETVATPEDIEQLADRVRAAWQLGQNPIPDMIDTLESQGVMVINSQVEVDAKFDGLAGRIGDTPVIVVSSFQPGDRQRFTLAHELGHLVLAGRLSEDLDEEASCNHFAGALLLPKSALLQHLGPCRQSIEPQEFYMLKHEFGLSMMGVLMRAKQCGVITEYRQKQCFKIFSVRGWRKKEPGDPYPQEQTFLFKQLVYRALAEDYIGESKSAELLGVSLASFHKERKLGGLGATPNQ